MRILAVLVASALMSAPAAAQLVPQSASGFIDSDDKIDHVTWGPGPDGRWTLAVQLSIKPNELTTLHSVNEPIAGSSNDFTLEVRPRGTYMVGNPSNPRTQTFKTDVILALRSRYGRLLFSWNSYGFSGTSIIE